MGFDMENLIDERKVAKKVLLDKIDEHFRELKALGSEGLSNADPACILNYLSRANDLLYTTKEYLSNL